MTLFGHCTGASSRTLARKLELARGTVADVYSQLVAEGYLESRVGAGTYVARDLGTTPFAAPGLGLITMRERVELAGGHFRLHTRPGEGTEITVDLPCLPNPSEPQEPPR